MEREVEFDCTITLTTKIKIPCEYHNGKLDLDGIEDVIADFVGYDLKNTEEDYDIKYVDVMGYEEVEQNYEDDERD